MNKEILINAGLKLVLPAIGSAIACYYGSRFIGAKLAKRMAEKDSQAAKAK